VASLGASHVADAGILGVTRRVGHELPESGLDLGEADAFVECVEHFHTDVAMRQKGAVRYQVAWDSNEYQLDMADADDREQYKRLIARNAELGVKYMVFEPRNSAVASRFLHTDNWWWESVLWFQMGIGIRNGSWYPGRQPLPPTVSEMLDAFKAAGVLPAAYVYPTLAWKGNGDDEWLYECTQREAGDGYRSSLASAKLQDYLIATMTSFLNVTGGRGFAWDYGIQGDTRVGNLYAEVRGWQRILAALRRAVPDLVMDHRQIAHHFNAWYHLHGTYSEPIAGDENPESYGASLASLSTDHILADNLRLTNYRYRLQMLPNDRIPGFMFHQSERSYNNGTGDDTGRPGDKINSDGYPLWKPDPIPGPDGNYSGVTYSNAVINHDWHTRDFDYLGYRYSVLSTIATAGRNLVLANVPARDLEEYQKFPQADIAWMRTWFDWADTNGDALRRTRPLLGYEYPRLGMVDGTAAIVGNAGFLFLFNPSPDAAEATLSLDASLGLVATSPASYSDGHGAQGGAYLLSEIHPVEAGVALGVWPYGERVTLRVPGGGVRIVRLQPWEGAIATAPTAFNISSASVRIGEDGAAYVEGATGLTGSTAPVVVRVTSAWSKGLFVNEHAVAAKHMPCPFDADDICLAADVTFGGSASLRRNARAAVISNLGAATCKATVTVTSAMKAQLAARQAAYDVQWVDADRDASWLIPSRLLLYLYVARPTPSLARPVVTIDGTQVTVEQQYNSRGNHANVPAQGGAVSGNTARTFLGWYVDCSSLKVDVPHKITISFNWKDADRAAHPFAGIFWHNVEDALTSNLTISDGA